jgi:predicted amidohydrolase YtcJ
LNALVSKTHKAGLQLAIHAIGDHAIERVLDAFENALKEHPRKNHRHRVEHCSVLNPKSIDRLKRLKLIASVQPHFVPSDFWVAERVGKTKARWVYPFKTLLQKKILVISGSDSPVEPIDPLLGIWAAVNRKDFPEERLTAKEALKTYTLNAAYSSSEENIRGTIEPGKLADLTVLSEDITKIPPERIRKVQVEMVVVNGKIVYQSKQRRL